MRRVAGALAVAVAVAVPAQAHTLSLAGAKRVAARKAAQLARGVPPPERVTFAIEDCARARTVTGKPKPHTVDCPVTFFFDKLGQACRTTIRVQFASDTSRSTRTSYPAEPRCKAT